MKKGFFNNRGELFFEMGGEDFTYMLMGLQWLEHRRIIVDRKMEQLTLEKN